MKNLNSLMVALCALSLSGLLLLVVPGCESFKSEDRNDLILQIAVPQGVARFVEAGATPAEQAYRKEQLIYALSVARTFVASDQPIELINWADEFVRLMHWDSIPVSDQVLLMQVITLVQDEIKLRIGDSDSRVRLERIIDLAISTASGFTF